MSGLGQPQKKFSETFRAVDLLEERFFSPIADDAMIAAEAVNDKIFRIAHDEVFVLGHTERKTAIARAIMAERERCFKAVLHLKDSGRKNLVFRSDALAAIRKGEA